MPKRRPPLEGTAVVVGPDKVSADLMIEQGGESRLPVVVRPRH